MLQHGCCSTKTSKAEDFILFQQEQKDRLMRLVDCIVTAAVFGGLFACWIAGILHATRQNKDMRHSL